LDDLQNDLMNGTAFKKNKKKITIEDVIEKVSEDF